LQKSLFFSGKDFFGRLPLHYLFYNLKQFDLNTFNTTNIYSLKTLYQNANSDKPVSIYFGSNQERQNIPPIDPVELLTILINNTESKFYDEKDIYGYTALHYAAMRGSTISCSLLISKGCDFLSRSIIPNSNDFKDNIDPSLIGNTPLSTAIYFKRESCVLAFLRSIEKKNKSMEANSGATLKDYYYLDHRDICDEETKHKKETYLEWSSSFTEKNLYPTKRLPLYQLILSYKWEGISWLILGDLEAYGLDYFESILSSILSFEFNLALRLIEKLQRKINNQMNFLKVLTAQSKNNSQRTLLHVIANLDLTSHQTQKPALIEILSRLFQVDNKHQTLELKQFLNSFLLVKDTYGTTALHYACCMQNFEIIDFILDFNSSHLTSVLDSNQQSPYALLFWRIGRCVYSKDTKEKIKSYTFKHVFNQSVSVSPIDNLGSLERVSKAYFPFVNTTDFKSEESITDAKNNHILRDYPPKNCNQSRFVSPVLYAINRQSFDMCKFLLKDLGFDVNTSDANKVNSMAYAVQTNNINLCKLLLNIEYDTAKKASIDFQVNFAQSKATSRMKVLFTSIDTKKTNIDDDECNSLDLSESETDEKPLTPPPQFEIIEQENSNVQILDGSEKFEVKSNLALSHLDAKQRSIFHHLACSLEYGSFQNTEICKLLFNAFNQSNLKLPALNEFLRRVDSNIRTASEYAVLNGNIELLEEFTKVLSKSTLEPHHMSKFSKFTITDKLYSSVSVDFSKDADLFLKKYSNATNGATMNGSHAEGEYFIVDPLSNMNKIGCLVWDQKANIPYDIILTKTDVSYGLYGMHNFYKMQLITHSFNHFHLKSKMLNNETPSTNGSVKKFDQNQMCVLFTRWGRIGDSGQYQRTPFSNFQEAKEEFCKIFKQKTGNFLNLF
jgi:ankyrin repeat protein